jgi:hypothetical protein
MERKLSSAEDVGEGKVAQDTQTRQKQQLLRLFRDFQGFNHKCGPVLFGFIDPSALNHFTPFWRFEKFGHGHQSTARF